MQSKYQVCEASKIDVEFKKKGLVYRGPGLHISKTGAEKISPADYYVHADYIVNDNQTGFFKDDSVTVKCTDGGSIEVKITDGFAPKVRKLIGLNSVWIL